jgi:hypothetical protein
MKPDISWTDGVPSDPQPYVKQRDDELGFGTMFIDDPVRKRAVEQRMAELKRTHGAYWRWFGDDVDDRVTLRCVYNLVRAGFTLRPHRTWGGPSDGMYEWERARGGAVYGYNRSLTGEVRLSSHAIVDYGHWLPDCESCGTPIEAYFPASRPFCHSCGYWLRTLAVEPGIYVAQPDGSVVRYQDAGSRPHATASNRSHLGFGGHWWHFEPIDSSSHRRIQSNNVFTQGVVPEHLLGDTRLQPTHVVQPMVGRGR